MNVAHHVSDPLAKCWGPRILIFYKLNISFRCYVDDIQLYRSTKPTAVIPPTVLCVYLQKIKSLQFSQIKLIK